MIKIGQTNSLKILEIQGDEIFLESDGSSKIFLIDKKRPDNCQVGDLLNVFVYVNSEGQLIATTQIPLAQVDEVAWLKVISITNVGTFLDWGLPKNLLVPFSEQHHEMDVGKYYLVKIFRDEHNRIAATTKLDRLIEEESFYFQAGQKVSLIIADKTELGFKAIVNNSHYGVLYQNELFQQLRKGQKLDGYIKQIREDNKIDLTLHEPGYGKVESLTDKILVKVKENNGVLMLSDKSPPEAIYAMFGVSKKVFKQAIGALYKQGLITIDKKNGITLV